MTASHFAGWLPCDNDGPHAPHDWVYTDLATRIACNAHCDGVTRAEPESTCCGDPLCPCGGYRGNYHGGNRHGSMDYPDLTPTTHSQPGSNGETP